VPLTADPQRFALAVWWLFQEAIGPYPAAYLARFLIEMPMPITAESIDDGALVMMSTEQFGTTTTVKRYADRLVRKAREVFLRSSKDELAWLSHSSGCILSVLRYTSQNNMPAARGSLKLLAASDVIERVGRRLDLALKSNLPEFERKLSRGARRLLKAQSELTVT
jgi:hypothetical protein